MVNELRADISEVQASVSPMPLSLCRQLSLRTLIQSLPKGHLLNGEVNGVDCRIKVSCSPYSQISTRGAVSSTAMVIDVTHGVFSCVAVRESRAWSSGVSTRLASRETQRIHELLTVMHAQRVQRSVCSHDCNELGVVCWSRRPEGSLYHRSRRKHADPGLTQLDSRTPSRQDAALYLGWSHVMTAVTFMPRASTLAIRFTLLREYWEAVRMRKRTPHEQNSATKWPALSLESLSIEVERSVYAVVASKYAGMILIRGVCGL